VLSRPGSRTWSIGGASGKGWTASGHSIVIGVGVGLLVAALVLYIGQTRDYLLGDAYTYLAAGERLNASHPLYALSAGDRAVPVQPPFWTAPLVSPPFIAVLWRPLAALPGGAGVALWWLGSVAVMVGAILWLARRGPTATGLAIAALCVPLAMEVGLGNVNGYLLAGAVALWALRDRPWSGAILGVMIAVKVWPLALALWLVGQRRWDALAWTTGTLAICALISLAGAGWANHVAYLDVAAGIHPSAFSLTWQLGIPWLWAAVLVLGLVLILVVRSRPDWSYRLAVLTMILGTPVVNPNTYAILLAAIAP
jgi:hypothetical protein